MMKHEELAYTVSTDTPFDQVVANIEKKAPQYQFRVLHIHDVQATLAEKGFQREPLKILEVCNSSFAHKALQQDVTVALFMPCRITVHTDAGKTVVSLGRPTMISRMLPEAHLETLASEVEATLTKVIKESV